MKIAFTIMVIFPDLADIFSGMAGKGGSFTDPNCSHLFLRIEQGF
jgi:hypothetical protein